MLKRSAVASTGLRPLIFQTSEDCCVCRPTGAVLASSLLLGLGDSSAPGQQGSAQMPAELLASCKKVAESQLQMQAGQEKYRGPIALLKEAYKATWTPGSTTVSLAALDNSTVIHGQLHPMIAMLSLGGCELLQLRRSDLPRTKHQRTAESAPQDHPSDTLSASARQLKVVFSALSQTDDANMGKTLSRRAMDTDGDSDALEAIEANTSVRCASARQGDIIVLMSSGLLGSGSLTLDQCVHLCNTCLPLAADEDFSPASPESLQRLAQRIAIEAAQNYRTKETVEATSDGCDFSEGVHVPGSVVIAELVEKSSDASETGPNATATEKCETQVLSRIGSIADDKSVLNITPALEGLESVKEVHCVMSAGDYALQVSLELPTIRAPKWPSSKRKSRARGFICDLD